MAGLSGQQIDVTYNPAGWCGFILLPMMIVAFIDMKRGGLLGYVFQWVILIVSFLGSLASLPTGYCNLMLIIAPVLMIELLVKKENVT